MCRYLNSMAAKYLFRADDIKAGEATAQRFTKDKLTGVSNLNDMQALWYEIESGMAHLRLGNLGMVSPASETSPSGACLLAESGCGLAGCSLLEVWVHKRMH